MRRGRGGKAGTSRRSPSGPASSGRSATHEPPLVAVRRPLSSGATREAPTNEAPTHEVPPWAWTPAERSRHPSVGRPAAPGSPSVAQAHPAHSAGHSGRSRLREGRSTPPPTGWREAPPPKIDSGGDAAAAGRPRPRSRERPVRIPRRTAVRTRTQRCAGSDSPERREAPREPLPQAPGRRAPARGSAVPAQASRA